MASLDVTLQRFLWNYVLPLVILMALLKIFRPQVLSIQQRIFAYMEAGVAIRQNANRDIRKRKQQLFSELHDMSSALLASHHSMTPKQFTLLEIGVGSGSNFKYYPTGTDVICVEPNPHFDVYLKKNFEEHPHVNLKQIVTTGAEDMCEVPDDSVDAVLCTFVLCSVKDTISCLEEVYRVLKPGGKFFYMEHVAADKNSFVYKCQRLVDPLWRTIAHGCSTIKETPKLVKQIPFTKVNQEEFWLETNSLYGRFSYPAIFRRKLMGVATK